MTQEKGFSVIEILVALAILAILASGVWVWRNQGFSNLASPKPTSSTPTQTPNTTTATGQKTGFKIAFYQDPVTEVVIANEDGTGLIHTGLQPAYINYHMAWSPDGERLAIESLPKIKIDQGTGFIHSAHAAISAEGPSEFFIFDLKTQKAGKILGVETKGDFIWAPSQKIAFYNRQCFTDCTYLLNPEDKSITKVTDSGGGSPADYSPDGKFLLIKNIEANRYPLVGNNWGILKVDTLEFLTPQNVRDTSMIDGKFSPDGKIIAMVVRDQARTTKVALIGSDASNFHLVNLPDFQEGREPTYINWIDQVTLIAQNHSFRGVIYKFNLDGTGFKQISLAEMDAPYEPETLQISPRRDFFIFDADVFESGGSIYKADLDLQNKKIIIKNGNHPLPSPLSILVSATRLDSIVDWKTYKNEDVTFKFPSDWKEKPILIRGNGFTQEFEDPKGKFTLTFSSAGNYNQVTGKPYATIDEFINMPYKVKTVIIDGQEGRQPLPRAGGEYINSVMFFSKDSKFIDTLELQTGELQTGNTTLDISETDIEEGRKLFDQILSTFKFLD